MSIFVFGEILWDVYPEKRTIGGAPFNFAAHMTKLGRKTRLISAVGNDELGALTREQIRLQGVDDSYTATNELPTGTCQVALNNGTPTFTLVEGCAYDAIEITEEQLAEISEMQDKSLYFGSLAQREAVSRHTLQNFFKLTSWNHIFFDVNLRGNFFLYETLDAGLRACTVLKLSREEAFILDNLDMSYVSRADYESDNEFFEALCKDLAHRYSIKTVILTLDKDGAMAYNAADGRYYYSVKPKCEVVSTVGAGDSFFAAFAHFTMLEQDIQRCLDKAVALSSYVVSRIESIPEYTDELCVKLMR